MPTTVFGWIVMLRPDGLQTCTKAEVVLIHQCVTVLATIKEYQVSSWRMSLIVSAVAIFGPISANVSFIGRAVLKTRMIASRAAGIIYLLETNTGTSSVAESCVIIEQYFNLMGRLVWVAGIVTLLPLKESRSAAQPSFTPNAFIMLSSNSIASDCR